MGRRVKFSPPEQLQQPDLLPIEHRSLQPKRLKKFSNYVNREAIMAGEWRRINKKIPHLLGHLLAPDDGPCCPLTKQRYPVAVSRRDAAVAASIIQWLGTNVGGAFIRAALKKIDDAVEAHVGVGLKRAVARSLRVDPLPSIERKKQQVAAVRARLKDSIAGGGNQP